MHFFMGMGMFEEVFFILQISFFHVKKIPSSSEIVLLELGL
jgi:hypothetical protein